VKERLLQSHTEIRTSSIKNAGYGVFTLKNFKKNEVIEECPFIPLKTEISEDLRDYVFSLKNTDLAALPLGYGCIYNHTELPNAAWTYDESAQLFIFKALKNIRKGEEIFTYYSPEWFISRKKNPKEPYKITKKSLILLTRIGFILLIFTILMLALLPQKTRSKMNQENLMTERAMEKQPVHTR
jgi:uncharacterized protein